MRLRFLFVFLFVLVILSTTALVEAGKPDPIRVNILHIPKTVQVGEAFTFTCQFIPLRGAKIETGYAAIYPGYPFPGNHTFIRDFSDHGPVIWSTEFTAYIPGEYEVWCGGAVIVDGVWFEQESSHIIIEVLP